MNTAVHALILIYKNSYYMFNNCILTLLIINLSLFSQLSITLFTNQLFICHQWFIRQFRKFK